MTNDADRAFEVALAGMFGLPAPEYGPCDPFTVARKKLDAYNSADGDCKDAAQIRMFGLPADCDRHGDFSDVMDAIIFLAFMQPCLGALPWNRGVHHYLWTAYPLFGDERFAVKEA